MKAVHVIFPVLRGARKFIIEKGRRWSVIEHLLLDAAHRQPASAGTYAALSGLPRRVVIEAFIRLMRAGWIEMAVKDGNLIFRATPLGAAQAPRDQLPATTEIHPQYRGFAIEQVTGGVFRSRELDIRPQSKLPVGDDDYLVIHLPPSGLLGESDLSEVFSALEGEDELFVDYVKSSEKLVERYAVVTVRDDLIEGLPGRATPSLRNLILLRAKETIAQDVAAKTGDKAPSVTAEPATFEAVANISKQALFDQNDLIIDGPAHEEAIERSLKRANERVIIHSTFVSDARANALLPLLLQAAARGVKIDIFWGQDDVGTSMSSSQSAALRLKEAIAQAGRQESISVHLFSTNSHAKIVVADYAPGKWSALVGSCNWLASDFSSFEVSVRLRDPALVGVLIRRLANLARGRPGLWHDLAVSLTVLGRRVEAMPRGNGRTVPMRLLFAPDHAKLAIEARDRAERRMFVLSHRLGIAAKPVALLPMLSAVEAKNIKALVFYGRTTGPVSGLDGAELAREFSDKGLNIRPVHRPRLHAKVLGWDDDALAISSLNWLSADPSDAAINREIGVLIEAPKSADNFLRLFEHARHKSA